MARRQQVCPIEASNIALFGSDLERQIKAAAAQGERAWDGVGQAPGIKIWRIEKFKVVEWPRTQIGKFFNGDSYIILHSYRKIPNAPLRHDIHFWLGEFTTQDEAGTAAYKTVELDDKLGGAPVQHREVQGHESDLFLGYFPENTIETMEGGIESGFKHVEVDKYEPRLLHVKGNRQNVRVTQVPLVGKSLNSGDVFILDLGLEIYQWNGKQASLVEKMRGGNIVRAIKEERGGRPEAYIFEEGDKDPAMKTFWDALGGVPKKIKSAKDGGDDADAAREAAQAVKLFRLSDKGGTLNFTLEKSGDVKKTDLDSNDAFILDNGAEVFVWIGKRASRDERRLGMQYAERYLKDNGRPPFTPISRVIEGGENSVFDLNFCSGGELCRDLLLDDPSERAPCCPHFPEGRVQQQPSAVSNLVRQQYGGRQPGAAPNRQPARPIQQAEVQRASVDAFSFFRNAEKMNAYTRPR